MGLSFLWKNEFGCQRWLIGCFIWVTFFNRWVGDSAGNTAAFVAATLFGASLVATRVVVQGIPSLSVAVLRFGQGELILFLCPSCPYHGCNLDSLFQDEICEQLPLLNSLIFVSNLRRYHLMVWGFGIFIIHQVFLYWMSWQDMSGAA